MPQSPAPPATTSGPPTATTSGRASAAATGPTSRTRTAPVGTPRHEPPLRVLVGAVLRGWRERQGRTLRDVAAEARVSVPYLSEVERGRKEASSEVLGAVCRALGMRLVDLVGEAHARLARADGRVVLDLAAAPVESAGRVGLASVHPLRAAPRPDVVALAA